MSSVVAIVKSIVGQVFAVSPEGVRRVLVEGDRLFVGDQVDTGAAGAVTLELADGRTLDLGRDTQWSGSDPDSSADLAQATAQAAPSVEELQQAIAAGADPTTDLEATAAGPTVMSGGGSTGGGHSFVALEATAGRVDPTIGFPTAGIGTAALAAQNTIGGQTAGTSANVQRESTLNLSATPTITEAGGVLVYTATLTQAPLTDLTITLSNGSVIVIQAGQLTGTVNVPLAPNDSVYNDPTQINVTVTGTTGGSGIIVTPPTTPAVTQVTDTVDTTTVTLTAGANVTEGGQITYTATLTNPAQTPVTITLSNGSIITIDAGKTTGSVNVDTLANDVYQNGSTVSTTITGATGGNFENLVPSTTPAVTTITDSADNTSLSLTATGTVVEGGQITYTATLTNPAGTPMTVTLSNGSVITIEAGKTTGSVTVDTAANDVYNNGSTVSTTITGTTGGNFEQLIPSTVPALTTVTDSKDNTGLSLSASTEVAEGGQITYTATLTNPAGTPVTVTLSNGAVITIAANATSGSVTVDAPKDDAYIDAGKVSATISTATGGNFENLVPSTVPAVTEVTDTINTSTVSLTANGSVTEGGIVVYTASVSAEVTGSPVVVTLSNGQTITIPVGSSSASVNFTAPNDALAGGSLSVKIDDAKGGNFEKLEVDSKPADTSITDTVDTTTVSLTATGSVAEGGSIVYTANLTHAAGTPVTVTLSNGAVITIAANATSGSVTVDAPKDDAYIDAGKVSATISTATGGNFENLVTSPAAAVTEVTDTINTSTVSLTTANGTVAEGGTVVYTASVGAPVTGSPVVVTLSNGQTITIGIGQSSGTVNAVVSNDVLSGHAPLTNSITKVSGGNYENLVADKTPVSTSVTDTIDTTTLSLSATGNVKEGGQITYTATLTHAAGGPVTVTLSNGATITIDAGKTTGTVKVDAPKDDVYKDAGKLEVTIKDAAGGNFENLVTSPTPAVTNVADTTNTTHLTLSAEKSVLEGSHITYTATLTNAAQTPVTVKLSNGETITIDAGKTSGSVTIAAPSDDVYKDAGKLTVTMTDATGGNFENLVKSPAAAVTTVTDTLDTSTVTLTANGTVAEGGTVVYTASVSAPVTGSPVVVTLSNGQTITIGIGQSSGTVNAVVSNDVLSGHAPLTNSITKVSGGNYENLVADKTPVSTSVTDTIDTTTLSLSATGNVKEGGQITYTATLTHAAGSPVTVTLSNGATITIDAGKTTGTVKVDAPKDDVYKDAGKLEVTIKDAAGGNFENLVTSPTPAVTNVADTTNTTHLTLSAEKSVLEGSHITYTATLTNAAQTPVTVKLSNGETITIDAGKTSGSVTIAAPSDDVHKDAGKLIVTMTDATGGNFENLDISKASVTTTVKDTVDSTSLSLSASHTVSEGGQITYTATLSNPTDTAMTVKLSNGAVINIAAGATTGSVNFAAPANTPYIDGGKVQATIASQSGGNFEKVVTDHSPAVTTVTDSADTTGLSLSATGSVAEGGSIVYTATLTHAAGSAMTVTLNNGAVIHIAKDATTGSVNFAAPKDDVYKDAGKVEASITKTAGGNFENLVTDKTPAVTDVTDTLNTSTVSLTANSTVAEGGTVVYTASVNAPVTGSPVVVTLSNGQSITIPVGASSASVKYTAPNDALAGGGSLSVKIDGTTGGNYENLVANQTPAVTSVTDVKDTTTLSLSATDSVAEGGSIVYTATLTHAAGTPVTVNLSNGAVISIAANATSGSVTVKAPADDVYKDAGKVEATIKDASGGNFENLVTSPAAAVTAVTDTINTSTVSLTTANGTVAEGGTVVYTASVSAEVTGSPVVVTLSNGQTITIPVGASSASVNFTVPNDALAGGGSLSVKIDDAKGGNYEKLEVNGKPADTSITDTVDTTTVSLSATGSVAEGGSIVYTANLTHAAGTPVTVNLSNGAVITIAANATSGSVTVKAPADDVYKDAGKVEATIKDASGGNFENLVTSPAAAVTEVTDTINTSTVSLTTANGTVAEGGTVVYTASVSAEVTGSPVVVTLSNGQTITIPVGSSSASVNFTAPNDALAGGGSLSVKINDAKGGNYEKLEVNGKSADTSITDTVDTTTVSLTATDSVAEGGSIVYTANLTHAAGTPVTVTLSNGAVITIAANATSGSVTVKAPADDVYKDAGKVEATIKGASGGNFENLVTSPAAAVTEVTDTLNTSTVSLKATPTAAEGGNVVYTASVTSKVTGKDVVVTLANGEKITIPVGESTASITVKAPNDALVGHEPLTNAIKDVTGGNYENLVADKTPTSTAISDTLDTTKVTMTASGQVLEGGNITYTANLTNAAGSDMTVKLSNGESIVIKAGDKSGSITVPAPADDVYQDGSKITVRIDSTSGGDFEKLDVNKAAHTTTVKDTIDTTTLKLSADVGSVGEGGQINYTATLNHPADTAMTVTLNNGLVINIKAGESSGSASFTVPNNVYTGAADILASIKETTGGNFEQLDTDRSAIVTKVTDTADTTNLTLSASGSVQEGGQIVYTATLSQAAGSNMTVKLSNGATITILKDAVSGHVSVAAPKDDVYKDAGKVEATIKDASGGNFENLVTSPTAAVTEVTDTINTSTVSLTTANGTVAEGGTVVYTASVSAEVTGSPVVVTLSNGQTITIPVGSSSASVNFTAPNDALVGGGSLSVKIDDAKGGNYEKLEVNGKPANTSITDTADTTTVSLTATDSVAEGGSIVYTANLTHAAGTPVTVTLSNGAVITIAANATSGSVTVAAPKDDAYIDAGKVSATISTATGGNFENLVTSPAAAVTEVTDTINTSTVSLTTANGTVAEGGTVVYTASVSAEVTGSPVVVTLSNGQTITIPVGASSASVNFIAPNDALAGGSSMSVKIDDAKGGNFEKLSIDSKPADTTVSDTVDTTKVTMTASDYVVEGGTITYTVNLSNAAGTDMTVKLSNGENVVIKAGDKSGSITLPAPADDVYKDGSKITVGIAGTSGGNFEKLDVSQTTHTTTVNDTTDTTTLKLSADVSTVGEGGQIVYTATLNHPADTAMTVTLNNGLVINIKAGESSGSAPYTVPNDVYTGAAPVRAAIADSTGGNFEQLDTDRSAVVTKVTDTADTTSLTLSASGSVQEGGQIVYTATLSHAAGSDMTVKLSNGAIITILKDAVSGHVSVDAPKDDVYLDAGKVTASIDEVSGGKFESLVPDKSLVSTDITDTINDVVAKLTVDNASVTEGGKVTYTVTLTNADGLPVNNHGDLSFTLTDGTVVKVAANQTSGSTVVTTQDNHYVNQPVTVVNQLTGVSGTNTFENLVLSADKTSVTITDNDHAPVSAGGAVAGLEDSTITLSWNDFKVTDLDNDSPLGITITQVSGGGTLLFNGAQVTLGQTISQADIALGKLTFVSAANESGADGFGGTGVGNKASDYAQIQFKPIDGFNQGTEATLKVDITPVADAPTLNVAGNNVTSTGLIKEVWTGLSGLGTDGNGAATNTLKSVIDGAGTPNSSSTVSNVQSEGDVAQGTASKTSGLIYLEAGKTYTFSGTGDDSLLVTIGGKNVAATTWGAGANLNGSFTPSASGYYTLDIYHHNQNGPGNYDVNLSVNGSPAVDLSSAGVPIYTGVADLTHAGVTVSDLHGSNGEGYYEGYKLNEGAQGTSVHLSVINTALTDTDGSEILSVKISGIPAGSVLTDGAGHTFTATATSGEANVTGWSLGTLTVTPPANYNGQFNLTVTSTSTETLGGSAPSTATIPVTVYPTAPVSEVVATLTVDKTSVAEGGQITYTVTLSNKDGIAISSHDELTFKLSDGTLVKVPANAASGSFSINAPDDILMGGQPAIVNKLESVSGADNFQQLTLAQNSTQTAVTDESGSGTSIDNQGDKVGITIVGNGAVLENQAPSFTIKLDKAQAVALTVKLSDGQTVTFAAGETEKVHTLAPQGEDVYKDGGTATLGISGATSGGTALENLVVGNPASVVITDTLSEVVAKLTVDKTTITEGGSVTYTVTLTNKDGIAIGNHDALTFKLTDGTIVTVPANSTSGSATVVTKDDVYTGGQTSLVNKLESVTGSDNFEKLTLNDAKLTTTVTDEPSGQGDKVTVSIDGNGGVAENVGAAFTVKIDRALSDNLDVTLSNGGKVTIVAGQTQAIYTAPIQGEDVFKDGGPLNLKVTDATVTGKTFENLVLSDTAGTVQITDTLSEVVAKLTVDKTTVTEGGSVTYTVTLTNKDGIAIGNHDALTFKLTDGTIVTVPANSTSGSATVVTKDDVYTGGQTSLVNKLESVTGSDNFEKLTLNDAKLTTTVTDEPSGQGDKVTVSIDGNGGVAENVGAAFTVKIDRALSDNLDVTLSNGGKVTIVAGQTQAIYTAPIQGEDVFKDGGPLNLKVTDATVTGKTFENLVLGDTAGTVQISDTLSEVVAKLTVDKTTVTEGGSVTYTVTLTNKDGIAIGNHDALTFKLTDGTIVTVPANSTSGSATVVTKDDVYTGGQTSLVNKLESVTGSDNFEKLTLNDAKLTTTVTDEPSGQGEQTTLGISGATSVNEGQAAHYTLTLSNTAQTEVTVTLKYTGTATNGVDYTGVVTVKIPANSNSVGFDINTIHDKLVEGTENFKIAIDSVSGGNFESLVIDSAHNDVSTNIVDNDHAPVSVGGAVAGLEDSTITLTWDNFKVTDVDNDSPLSITITQVSAGGTLLFNGMQVSLGQTISQADIALGKLTFVPATNASGANGYGGTGVGNQAADYAQIKFKPTDGFNQGTEATLKVDITPVADAPTLNVASNNVTSTGLIKEVWTGLSGLGTDGSGANTGTLKSVIDGAGKPNSSATVTNVQSDGSVAAGTASKTSGLIYLEAGKTYTFSGTGDDSLLVTIGGKNVAATTWGAGGSLNGSFTPTTSGYYTLDIYHHNQSGPGNYDVNLSVNGSAAVDLSSAGVPLYTGIADLAASGVTVSDLHGTSGEGYYEGYKLNEAAEGTSVHLSAIKTALTDIDGSESLSVKISGIPAGSVLTDGAGHTFTASATFGEANVTGWNLGSLTVTPPPYYNGQFNLTVTSTSTESLGGSAQSTATIPVTVYPTVYNAVTATAANDTITGTDGNDIMVADIGGLTVVPGTNYNIAFMVDSSGSMSASSINSAKDSLTSVFNTLKQSMGGNSGTVNIFLADFDNQVNKSVSVNLNDPNALTLLKSVLDSMSSGGGTNYEDVFKTTANWFQSADPMANTGAKNLTYFITDGKPTYYQSGEQTNPTLFGNVKLDDVITTSNYKLGQTYSNYLDSTHYLTIDSAGNVTLQTQKNSGRWNSDELGTLHAEGNGTYELSYRDGTGSSTSWDAIDNSTDSFALLGKVSTVEAIGINKDVTLADLKPYDSDQTPQTNIDPKDLANSIIGHTEATMPGADTVNGGDGNDILFGDLVSFNGVAGEGYQAMQAFVAQQTGVDASKVTTSNVHQFITEHYTAFDVSGAHDGNDSLLGGAGNDILFGQGGNDLLDAGKGNDILLGGSGNDSLMGGQGNDILIGGSGADTFVWKAGDTGSDVIKDFKASEGDRIDLRDLLQGETGSTIDNFLKITTVDGVSSLQVSSAGKFNGADAAAAAPDVTIKLEGNNWSSANINSLIAGSDPTIKIDHNNT